MKKTTFSQFSKQGLMVYSTTLPFYEVYLTLIRPFLNEDQLNFQFQLELSRPTIVIQEERLLAVTNNFELFIRLKLAKEESLRNQSISYDRINLNQYHLEQCFYELIQTISRYYKQLHLSKILDELSDLLSTEACKDMFNSNQLSKIEFSRLINISERTLHRLISESR
ncbi:hypothetical protein PSAR109036_14555 [Psychrobacter arenosus]|uniref:hypothetical protein n=1 Tax=Psychrobacter arenosus TaxID=256326 RepID=UPI001917B6D2|nr:hypothetical protein [Psychrobacter arenosus]